MCSCVNILLILKVSARFLKARTETLYKIYFQNPQVYQIHLTTANGNIIIYIHIIQEIAQFFKQ